MLSVRSWGANHVAESGGPIDIAIGPAHALRNWPTCISTADASVGATYSRHAAPAKTSAAPKTSDALKPALSISHADGAARSRNAIGPQLLSHAIVPSSHP